MSVLLVDRFMGGGASAASGGVLYAGGGTHVQTDVGVDDTVTDMANYLAFETGDVVSRDTLDRFCKESASHLKWLETYGVKFSGPLTLEKTSYPNHDFLYYSGNERLAVCAAVAPPAPRGHRANVLDGEDPATTASGYAMMTHLLNGLRTAPNARFKPQTALRRLVVTGSGCVIGAELWEIPAGSLAARLHRRIFSLCSNMAINSLGLTRPLLNMVVGIERRYARRRLVQAKRGVVLATGGYSFNQALLNQIAPVYAKVTPLGTIADDGSGILIGCSAGGATARMATISAWRHLYPPTAWTKGVLVGPQGDRLTNEESYAARNGMAIMEAGRGRAWLILDRPLFSAAKHELSELKIVAMQRLALRAAMTRYAITASTMSDLARKLGIPAAALEKTIENYNDDITNGREDAMGKAEKLRRPIAEGPFTAIDMSCETKLNPLFGITTGGLRVDETTGVVLDSAARPISGLYAVGRTAVGLPSNFYVSGLSLSDCVFSGLRAARAIADGG
jgi:3-oxo-5alpha-steroid 4-dehydrogenase